MSCCCVYTTCSLKHCLVGFRQNPFESYLLESIGLLSRDRKTRSRVCGDLDRISPLSDDLLVKILSFLPTRVAVSTSILSKRWECLWMWLPKLKYDSSHYSDSELISLWRFLDLNMPLHKAPVIESFHLKAYYPHFNPQPQDVKLWLVIALSRHLREPKITYRNFEGPNILPSSLYTCTSLGVDNCDRPIVAEFNITYS